MGKIKIKNNLLPCSTKHQIFIIKKQEIFKPKKNDHVAALFGLEGVNGKLSPSHLLNIHNIRKSHTRFLYTRTRYHSQISQWIAAYKARQMIGILERLCCIIFRTSPKLDHADRKRLE